jgi:lysine biosynthesis protein LysW
MIYKQCLYCEEDVIFPDMPELEQKIICPKCGERFEVVSLNPIEIGFQYQIEDTDEYWGDYEA